MRESDDALMTRIQKSQDDAFEELIRRYESVLHAHILRTVRNTAVADDVVQEVLLRVWTRSEQYQAQGSVKGWLYRIATNQALNQLRSIAHGCSEGLTTEEFFASNCDSHDRLGASLQGMNEFGQRWEASHRADGHHVLSRAMRSDHPGAVFARAAAAEEVDPLVDIDARLFVGLGED